MNIQEFKNLAIVTMSMLGSPILDSTHMVLGMATEMLDELGDAIDNNDTVNVAEELGDTEWYIVNYATIWDFELPEEFGFKVEEFVDMDFYPTIGKLQDLDKKELAYRKIAPVEERQRLCILLLKQVEGIAFTMGIDMGDVRAKIIAKLKARYGAKFNAHAAINRNLDVERAILEGK